MVYEPVAGHPVPKTRTLEIYTSNSDVGPVHWGMPWDSGLSGLVSQEGAGKLPLANLSTSGAKFASANIKSHFG